MRLTDLNAMDGERFVDALGDIFEHSPWVAQNAYSARPFSSKAELHAAMCRCVQQAAPSLQRALIDAHPELAGKAALASELTEASLSEQVGAGLDRCTAQELGELTSLNREYRERFDFPFIIAVRGHSRLSIIAALRERLAHSPITEFLTALEQIERIAFHRLNDRIS